MRLGDISSDHVVTVSPSNSVERAFSRMVKHDIRHLPVVEDGRVVGIVSDRDLLMIVCWISAWKSLTERSTSVGKKQVAELMSSPVSVLSPDDSVEQAARLMLDGRFSAVPLEQDGQLTGIVTELDLLKCYVDDSVPNTLGHWREVQVADQMAVSVVTAKLTDRVMPSFKLMQERQIRHLPIVEGEELLGLISDRDLRRSYGREIAVNLALDEPESEEPYHVTLEEIMTRRVETVDRHSTLAHAASRMAHCKFGALPVTEQGKLQGMITETDLLRVFLDSAESG